MPGGSINLGHVVGPGVPAGGTVGQVMRKKTGTDYDTEWHSLDDSDIQSSAVSGQTTVEGALGSLSQQIEDLGPVNNLTSDSTTAALSAAQGKILNGQIAELTPVYLTNVFTATHQSVDISYQFAAIIGNVIIGTISFTISANIADGTEMFVFTDPTRLWDSTTLYSMTVRVNDNTALPLLLKVIKNTNQITAYSNIETNVARWSSITFVGKIKEV